MSSILLNVGTPFRGPGTQAAKQIPAQSLHLTTAWGLSPASATVVYVGDSGITEGAAVTITAGPHTFYGNCITDSGVDSASGQTRTLEFRDNRMFLTWDIIYGAFNKPDARMINGVWTKRYKHMLPANFNTYTWTYTAGPLSAHTILQYCFTAATVQSPWVRFYHAVQSSYPVFDIDCLGGKELGAVIGEISERQGLVVGLGGAWNLVWARKGAGAIPAFPVSDDRRLGVSLSGNPSRVRIIGGRNLYQLTVDLLPDWSSAWGQFPVMEIFEDDIFQRGLDPFTNIAYKSIVGDPEQYIGRQLARARALTITVREYAALRNDTSFLDGRRFSGRARNDMPAALYITTILYRAFRPDLSGDGLVNVYGDSVPLNSLEIVDRLLAKTSHEPLTGDIAVTVGTPDQGNGYAIVRGYQVGSDSFRTLRPDQLQLDRFADTTAVWQHAPFQIDDSGEGNRFIIFDEPVIISNDLLAQVDGQVVISAGFHLSVPEVAASLVFAAEPYSYIAGVGGRDAVENVSQLNGEFVIDDVSGLMTEVPYANGDSADDFGAAIAASLILRQFSYADGGFKIKGLVGYSLTDTIDRITVHVGPDEVWERVDLTNERRRDNFEPERELDRATQLNTLFPGQAELRQQSYEARAIAAGFKANPLFTKSLSEVLNGSIGGGGPLQTIIVKQGVGALLPAGAVIRKAPTVIRTPNTGTLSILPANAGATENIFVGVTVRHNEPAGVPLKVQSTGHALARVQGPVSVQDQLGLSDGPDDFLKKDGTVSVGKALQAITGAVVQLIPVMLGSGGGTPAGDARWS